MSPKLTGSRNNTKTALKNLAHDFSTHSLNGKSTRVNDELESQVEEIETYSERKQRRSETVYV